jgi:hypothetical protein
MFNVHFMLGLGDLFVPLFGAQFAIRACHATVQRGV